MVRGILGKKLGMTQIFDDQGRVVPVTVVQAGPCVVVQRKTADRDGYESRSARSGGGTLRTRNANQPITGHFGAAGVPPTRFLAEVPVETGDELKPGDAVLADIFKPDDTVHVIGRSKGRGFQGVIRRHNFGGGRATHGSMFHRAPGGIGQSADPSRVYPGTGMPGQMGNARVTVTQRASGQGRRRPQPALSQGRSAGRAPTVTCASSRRREGAAMNIDVRNWDNEIVGDLEVPDEVFAREVNQHLVWEVVRAHLASRRRGTHKTKVRGEVAGTGAKPWKQKHTGRARAGERRSPLWRSGGTVHGPRPRSYAIKVNRKARRVALQGVLSQRLAEGRLLVLDNLELDLPKTKDFIARLGKLGVIGEKVLLVDGLENLNLHLASRNRPEVKMLDATSLSVYEVLNHRWLVASEPALRSLVEVLS